MTTEEWCAVFAADPRYVARKAKVMAGRPPLTPAQIAVLRPICLQMIPHMKRNAASTRPETAPALPEPLGGIRNAPR